MSCGLTKLRLHPPLYDICSDTESRHSSTRQSQISSSSGGGVVNVQLASLSAGGQFLPTTDEELFIVTQQHSSNKEGFLSVEKGTELDFPKL